MASFYFAIKDKSRKQDWLTLTFRLLNIEVDLYIVRSIHENLGGHIKDFSISRGEGFIYLFVSFMSKNT